MNKFKKTLSVVMAALMLVLTVMTYVPANAAEVATAAPEVAFVGVDHSPLVAGDTEMFTLTTKNADKVQYNVVLNDATGKLVEDLTKGYATETAGNVPFAVKAVTPFAAGKYTLVVNAKRVSDGKVATYSAALNGVSKDNANRIYANGDVDIAKADYAVGEKVVVNGVKNLGGIAGPYMYKLHVYNATTGTWTKNVVANYGDKLEWTPTVAGTYVLDIYVNSQKSTTWAKYAKNPSSDDVYGTYEAWKLVTINVVDALKVTGVKAPNKNTVQVTYNMDVKESAVAANFAVYDKGNEYGLKTISAVVVAKNVVTLTLADTLVSTKEFTVESKNVPAVVEKATAASSKDNFTYTEVKTPASIAFKATTVSKNAVNGKNKLGYTVKDKDGNDITVNMTAGDIVVETSSTNIIAADLTIGTTTGSAIVNLTVKDSTIKTGNTIISVVDTTKKPASIGRVSIVDKQAGAPDYTKPVMSIYKSSIEKFVKFEALNQDGDEMTTPVTKSFRSYSPTIAVVDETNGAIYPVAIGTATILVTAKDANDVSISKTVTVEVKADADINSLKSDKTSVTVVKDSNINAKVTINVLDQYGKVLNNPSKNVTAVIGTTPVASVKDADGNWVITVTPDNTITEAKSVVMTITCGALKQYVTVSYVKPATFAGYTVVSTEGAKLDLTTDNDLSVGATITTVVVYQLDTNGNNIAVQSSNVTLATEDKGFVTTVGQQVTAAKVGTEVITVKVGTVTVGTITLTVVNSTKLVSNVSLVKNVVSVAPNTSVFTALFGTDKEGNAFIGYDQYGNKLQVNTTDVQAFTSNSTVVGVVSNSTTNKVASITAGTTGTATVTVLVAGKVYTVTVKVQ